MYKYGDIYYANMPSFPDSSIQSGKRPVMIVSNDMNNYYSNVVTTVPLTTKPKRNLPTHVQICGYGLERVSTALCEQICPIDKGWLLQKVGHIDNPSLIKRIIRAIMIQLNINQK